jgi:hypothetical protein
MKKYGNRRQKLHNMAHGIWEPHYDWEGNWEFMDVFLYVPALLLIPLHPRKGGVFLLKSGEV